MKFLFRKKPQPPAIPPEPFNPTLTFSDPVSALVRQTYESASRILEYGSGGSTVLAASLGKPAVSVESDGSWAQNMRTHLREHHPNSPVQVVHVDIGPTVAWGRPKFPKRNAAFHRYPLSVWDNISADEHPDVVLVDGRFRVACFLTVAFHARKPVRLLFDDYLNRPQYHLIEEVARPVHSVENMAVFDLKPGLDLRPVLTRFGASLIDPD